jgi:hypothetical protein
MGSDGDSVEAGRGLTEARKNLLLAKMLLEKYGALHSFHTEQLQRYTIACCNYAIAGNVAVYAESKRVTFDIKTKRDYCVKDSKIKPRFKYSLMRLFYHFKWEKEVLVACDNLTSWTRELLWPNTSISISIDGKLVYGKPYTDIPTEESNE